MGPDPAIPCTRPGDRPAPGRPDVAELVAADPRLFRVVRWRCRLGRDGRALPVVYVRRADGGEYAVVVPRLPVAVARAIDAAGDEGLDLHLPGLPLARGDPGRARRALAIALRSAGPAG